MKEKNSTIIFAIVVLFMTYFTISCNNHPNSRDYAKLRNKKIQNLNTQKSKLIGKKIISLDSILQDSAKSHQKSIIFYYEGTDCQTCVYKCFSDIKKTFLKNNLIDVKIIASNTKISSDQLRYEYFEKIYDDRNGLLKRDLMFLYSPAFIYLKNGRIDTIDFILPDSKIDILSNIQNWSK
jgi:hypothetical protein